MSEVFKIVSVFIYLGNIGNPENFNYGRETLAAMREDRLSDDILEEHKKLSDAEIIIFQFPMYWSGFPAILKGWFDRIFTQGFAFGPDMMFDKAFFKVFKFGVTITFIEDKYSILTNIFTQDYFHDKKFLKNPKICYFV